MFDLVLVQQRQKTQQALSLPDREKFESSIQLSIQERLEFLSIDFHSPITLTIQDDIRQYPSESADFLLSFLSLHWCDDVQAFLKEARRVLQPGGHFMAVFIGGESLFELREALTQAELTLMKGVAPRISPMIDIKDAGMLLQRAGFQEVVVDRERNVYILPSLRDIFTGIKNFGENNALMQRDRRPPHRNLFAACEQLYQGQHGAPEGLPVTIDMIYMLGSIFNGRSN